jgi:hypothetical protein
VPDIRPIIPSMNLLFPDGFMIGLELQQKDDELSMFNRKWARITGGQKIGGAICLTVPNRVPKPGWILINGWTG